MSKQSGIWCKTLPGGAQPDGPPQPEAPPPTSPGKPDADTDPFAKDAYNTLHVSPDADVDAIKTAYHGVADGLATAHDGKSEVGPGEYW
jgi:hypothetical protein